MAFRRTYDEIREMIKRTVLTAPMARAILRKAGFRPGAGNDTLEGGGVPPGGLKGWALAKKSDADYDVWWVPNGPYDTDWINDPSLAGLDPAVETNPTFPPAVLNDSIGDVSQPASVMASNWSAINEPLRSGVSNQGNLGFVYDPWHNDLSSSPAVEAPKPTLHEVPALGSPLGLIDIANASTGSGDMSVSRTAHHAQAPRQWRLQAYVTQCSSDAVLYAYRTPGLFDTNINITMPLSGPGYYDSGWQAFPAASRSQTIHHVHKIFLYEPSIRDPAIPFVELQMRLYEFPKWFDWMYQR